MTRDSGDALEKAGFEFFEKLALPCAWHLNHTPLTVINPQGAYSKGENLEVDYLVPLDDVCLIGEITSRTARDCPKKLTTFQKHINAIDQGLSGANNHAARFALWKSLGVPDEDLHRFRNVRRVLGFAILTAIEECEIPAQVPVANMVVLYRYHWDLLREYANTIGRWAQFHFLQLFNLTPVQKMVSRPLRFQASKGNLLAACDHYVTANREQTSHVVTFLASPYDLLPYASVCRRDALPSLGSQTERRYQRTLFPDKLSDIRKHLLNNKKFIFPNSILVVLSNDCEFDSSEQVLEISDAYGALKVVDGQHRLFSYADAAIEDNLKDDAQILVTAIVFESAGAEYIERFSARTFIEINTNQTRVSSLHLYGIGYEILGDANHKYLAAHILRKANERNNPLRGLLRTSDSPRGKIQSMEIIGSLGVLTNVDKMDQLSKSTGKAARVRQSGVENLIGAPAADLTNPEVLTRQGVICLERYFRAVASVFTHDWPQVGSHDNGSSFSLTKFFAALVRLLRQFIDEGGTWDIVQGELGTIRDNVMGLRRLARYRRVLFDQSDPRIPDATARVSDMFRFLNENRRRKTSISKVMKDSRR